MADFVRVPETDWQAICDAVRGKTGEEDGLLSGAIASAVGAIKTEPTLQDLTVTANGAYSADESYDGLGVVTVNVASGSADRSVGLLDGTLTEYEDSDITNLRRYAFYYSPLKKIALPKITSIGSNAFRYCSVELLELGTVGTFPAAAFANCSALNTMILRQQGLVSLSNVSAFNGTPFASGGTGGTVYVPSALISKYQAATNWSTLYSTGTCNFAAIEGSEYE